MVVPSPVSVVVELEVVVVELLEVVLVEELDAADELDAALLASVEEAAVLVVLVL